MCNNIGQLRRLAILIDKWRLSAITHRANRKEAQMKGSSEPLLMAYDTPRELVSSGTDVSLTRFFSPSVRWDA